MTGRRVEPVPSPEEAAAILAALAVLREERQEKFAPLRRSRWRLAGVLGHPFPVGMELEGALWSYRGWEGMV